MGNAPVLVEGDTYTIKVSLSSAAPSGGATIPLGASILLGQAADYTVPTSVTIPQGQTSATFDIEMLIDEMNEDRGFLTLTLCPTASCPTGYTAGMTPVTFTVFIADPTVVTDVSGLPDFELHGGVKLLAEGNSGTFTIALQRDPVVDATITVKPVDGEPMLLQLISATASDHIGVDTDPDTDGFQNMLTFTGGNSGNWSVPQTVRVYALYDDDANTDAQAIDSYTIGFLNSAASGPYKAQVNTNSQSFRLNVSDAGNAVVVSPDAVSVAASGTVEYDVQLASDPGGTVVVTPTSSDTVKATVSSALTFTSSNWNVPQQITVTGAGVGTTTITHAVTTATTAYPVTLTIEDVDVTVTPAARNLDIQVTDAYEGENIVVTLTLSRAPGNVPAAQRTIQVGTQVPLASTVNTCITSYGCAAGSTPAARTDVVDPGKTLDVVFGANETVKTASIPVVADSVSEGVEVIEINIVYNVGSDQSIFTFEGSQVTGRTRIASAPLVVPGSLIATSYGQILGDTNPTAGVTVTMSGSDGDSDGNAVEGANNSTGYRTITLTLGQALTAGQTVTVPLTVIGATVTDDYTFALQPSTQTGVTLSTSGTNSAQNPAVVFASGAQTATLRLTPVDNNDRTQPYVVIDYGAGSRAPSASGGITLTTPSGGPIGVVLVDDETGDIVLPAGASFRPEVNANLEYRMMFMTSEGGPATSTDIADYDHFVRYVAIRNGDTDLLPYVGFFKAFVSTASVDGRENVGIWDPSANSGAGGYADGSTRLLDTAIWTYWLGGDSVARNDYGLCNTSWTNRWSATVTRLRHEDGSEGDGDKVWTGMNNNCTTSGNQLGTSTPTYGPGTQEGSGSQSQALSLGTEASSNTNRFYAVSEIVKSEASAAMPEVLFGMRSFSGIENATAEITIRANPAPAQDLVIGYTASSTGEAVDGEDFTAGSYTVTIPAGQTSVTFNAPILDDNKFEGSETIRLLIHPSPNYLRGVQSVVVTILENDEVTIGFEQPEFWVLEDSGTFNLNLTLNQETEQDINLTLAFEGTATDGSDYTAPSTSVTIPSGNTSGTHPISIPITADSIQEADETIVVRIASVSTSRATASRRDGRTTLYIADQDHASAGLVLPSSNVEVDEGVTTTYYLRLATAPTGTVTVTISGQSSSTLTVDADDAMNGDQNSVQFTTSNWYIGRKITVRGVHDPNLADTTVTLGHSASNGGYDSVTGNAMVDVEDDDVTLSITGGSAVTEGTAAEFTVTANPAPARDLTINLRITDATGADFLAPGVQGNRTRTLDAGETSATFEIATVADNTTEPSGTIGIALRTSDKYIISSTAGSTTVQVNDDDAARVTLAMSVSDGDANGNAVEGANNSTGYRTITLTLGQALTAGQTVTVPLTVVGATVTDDYTFALQPSTQTGVSLSTSGSHSAQDPAVEFSSGGQTATLRLTPVDNSDRSQPYVIVAYGTDSLAPSSAGPLIELADPTGGPFGFAFVDDETGEIEVAVDWPLAPSGLSSGDKFRLMFFTSESRNAAPTDIDVYNEWAQAVVANGGHANLLPYGGMVRVIGSTASTDARENTGMWDPALNSNAGGYPDGSTTASDSGVKIYWLAEPSTNKIADNYFDFYDNSWDVGSNLQNTDTFESGADSTVNSSYWTGSSNAGTGASGSEFGATTVAASNVSSGNRLNDFVNTNSGTKTFLVMSPVFTMEEGIPDLTFASSTYTVNEDAGTVSVTVNASEAPASPLTVNLRKTDGTARGGGTDFTNPPATFTFPANMTSHSFTVSIFDDGVLENHETFSLTLQSGTGYTVGTQSSTTVTITDQDTLTVSILNATYSVGEADGSVIIEVLNNGDSDIGVLTTLTPSDGTATGGSDATLAGVDYDNDPITPITIPAGVSSVDIGFAINDDSIAEMSETFTLALTVVGGQRGVSLGSTTTSTVTITDNDTISVAMSATDGDADGNAVEGANNSTGYRTITITLGQAPSSGQTITVPLTVQGATVTTDYTFGLNGTNTGVSLNTSGTNSAQNPAVVFSAGASSATLRLMPVDNNNRTQPYVVIDYGTGPRAPSASGGFTLATPTGGPIGVGLVDDEMGDINVSADWALTPSGLSQGDEFRLIFITSETRDATSTDIDVYNAWAQELVAKGGHASLQPYGGMVRVVGSTASEAARENTGMWDSGAHVDGSTTASDTGVQVYWLAAPPSNKVADNYFDFYDGSWDGGNNRSGRDTEESGSSRTASGSYWTGTSNSGGVPSSGRIGDSNVNTAVTSSGRPLSGGYESSSLSKSLLVMSPVFKVSTDPVISVALPNQEGVIRTDAGEQKHEESTGSVLFPMSADQALSTSLTVCLRVTESGGDRVASTNEGIQTGTLQSTGVANGAGNYTLNWTDTAADDQDSSVTVELVAPGTSGCTGAGAYTVSTDDPSDKILIQDDESTTVSLTSSDMTMGEGDASDTATLTVSLSRRLYAGEIIAAPIALATSTDARLPGHVTPDFAVAASGTGVTLENASASTPRVIFTGSDSNVVQTATVTLTPVANRNDGDADDETITATLTSLGVTGLETTVSGGVAAHSSNSAATLTIDDDETAPCSAAQSTALSVSDIRMTENGGETTYCVRLTTAPSGGDTTVTIGMAAGVRVFDPSTYTVIESVSSGAATLSTSTLTFTTANYTDPQPVTVTAVDEAGTHRNRRFNLTHTANGGGYSSQALGTVPVLVNDAPELEVFEYRHTWDDAAYRQYQRRSGWSLHRPNTITSTPGILASNDILPAYSLDYYVRLSSQPDGDVTVTLNVTDIPGYDASTFTGISFSPTGTPQQTLTFTFTDANPNPGCGHHTIGRDRYFINSNPSRLGLSETYDPNKTRISWKCYKAVYALNTRGGNIFDQEGTMCADVVHTATGGGLRRVAVDTLRIHNLGKVYGNNPQEYYKGVSIRVTGWWRDSPPKYTFDSKTQKFNVEYGPATYETRTVNNIALYKDSGTGKYYDLVTYQRGTRIWIMREVPSSAFNTVWDQSGPTVLANTLNLDTVYSSTGRTHNPADCNLLRRAQERLLKGQNSPLPATAAPVPVPTTAVENLLLTASDDDSSVTVTWDAVEHATKYNVDYTADGGDDSLAQSAGHFDDITATSLTFNHGLSSLDTLTVTVTPGYDSGEMGGTVYLNSLAATATLSPGSSSAAECTPNLPNDAVTLADVTGWRDASPNDTAHVLRWNRVLAALGVDTGETPMTIAESIANESALNATRWDRVTRTLQALAQCSEATEPEISIAAGSDVTEGTDATFTITASPTPTAALSVSVTVSQSGDYATSTGAQTVTIPTSGSYTLTVATTNDSTDESDGSVTATVDTGTGYTVSSSSGSATVAVADDDPTPLVVPANNCVSDSLLARVRSYYDANKHRPPNYGENWKRVLIAFGDMQDSQLTPYTAAEAEQSEQRWSGWKPVREALVCIESANQPSTPVISIAAGSGVTEGSDATFTVTASPTPTAALTVSVTVSQSGDYAASTGAQTISIPTTGSYTLAISTTNDSTDESDGSVTATVDTGTGYTVSSSNGSATVAVSDDDVPEISISAGSGVTEGSDATFTVTASPTPAAPLSVSVTVSQSGDYAASTGTQTVTIPTSGSYTLTISTTNDSTDESDGSVTATVDTGTGYTVSSSSGSATVAVSDDDPTPSVVPAHNCVSDSLLATVRSYYDANKHRTPTYGENWKRVLIAFGDVQDSQLTPYTAAEAEQSEQIWSGWKPVREALACIEAANQPATPVISIAAGSGVTEGSDATFTITASPTPTAALTISITVSQSGNFGATTGAQTVTIPTSGSYTLTVATTNDSTDEADGSVTATVDTGTGYTVSSNNGSATVAISDDDDPPPATPVISIASGSDVTEGSAATFTITASPAPTAALSVSVTVSQSGDYAASTGAQTVTIPTSGSYTLTISTTNDSTDESDGSVTAAVDTGTGYTVSSSNGSATVAVADDDVPDISITSGGDVTEGSDATFTITSSPTPATALSVSVTVSQSGNFGASTGTQTISIPTSGSYTLTISTTNDSTDEADGSITASVDTGTGYTVSSSNGSATVAVSDDDDPTPVISIASGSDVTEGSDATFTVTASPVPTAPLSVSVTVSQSGDYAASTGTQTISIPTSGSYTLTVSTTNDSTDESDGSVTATVDTGTGYTVSSSNGSATVAVSDDDDPAPTGPPALSVGDASASEGDAQGLRFIVEVAPASDQTIVLGYGAFGRSAHMGQDFEAPYQEFTLEPGQTRLEIELPIIDDDKAEENETLTFYLYARSGIVIPGYFLYAKGTIVDND